MARRQITLELLVGPTADAPVKIGGDVVGLPALDNCAGELSFVVQSKQDVARRVAIAAMAKRLDEIGAAIPLRRLVSIRPEAMRWLEQRIPEHHEIALIERKGDVVRRRGVFTGFSVS